MRKHTYKIVSIFPCAQLWVQELSSGNALCVGKAIHASNWHRQSCGGTREMILDWKRKGVGLCFRSLYTCTNFSMRTWQSFLVSKINVKLSCQLKKNRLACISGISISLVFILFSLFPWCRYQNMYFSALENVVGVNWYLNQFWDTCNFLWCWRGRIDF